MTEHSTAYLGGYVATRAGIDNDPTLLQAANKLDPERVGYHREVFLAMGGKLDVLGE